MLLGADAAMKMEGFDQATGREVDAKDGTD